MRPSEMLLSNQGGITSCAKIAIQIPKTYIYPTPLLRFINNSYGFWPSEKPLHLLPLYWNRYTEGVPQMCSLKKAFCCRRVAYLQRNTEEWMFSCKLAKCRTLFSKNTSRWLLLNMWKWIKQMPAVINLFRVNIEKLEQSVK